VSEAPAAPALEWPVDETATHIMVVDDDDRLRELLRRFLCEQGFVVVTAADAKAARAQLALFAVDLIVLDVMMPGGEDGLSLTRALRKERPIPILLLTARGRPEDRIEGLEAGADDYLPKPFEPRELVLRIASILRRARPAPPPRQPIVIGRFRFDADRQVLSSGDETVPLTGMESALLAILAAAPGQVFGREALVAELGAGVNERTIDVQVTRLRRKLEDDSRAPRTLQTVRGEGYVLRLA
jgi:two-component system phosphate regulon response regulator OmpR